MATIKIVKISPMSLARISGVIYCILGLLGGAIITTGSLLGVDMTGGEGDPNSVMYKAGVFIFPVIYGIIGFVGGLISAFLFNLTVSWVGTLNIEVES